MPRYCFDIEGNGLLDEIHTVHCIALVDLDTDELHCFAPDRERGVAEGLAMLAGADLLVGHNIIRFDLPAIRKCHPEWSFDGTARDTLLYSNVLFSNLSEIDAGLVARRKIDRDTLVKQQLWGRHKLEAWGLRLGFPKGDFKGPWHTYTPEMGRYCCRDAEVTAKLWRQMEAKGLADRCVELEHATTALLAQVEANGFPFDTQAASSLWADIVRQTDVILPKLQATFPPVWRPSGKTETTSRTARFWRKHVEGAENRMNPKSGVVERGWYEYREAGATFTPIALEEFNPGSRPQVARRIMDLGWQPRYPDDYTDGGQVKVAEKVLRPLPYSEAHLIADYLRLGKVQGLVATGDGSWLKCVRNDVMHPAYITSGTVTGRASHMKPNIAQTPKVRKDAEKQPLLGLPGGYGYECRSLYHAPPGYRLVGADMSSLELRCLAHFMGKYDGGEYAKIVVAGDTHEVNREAFGLWLRDSAKTAIYAILYGGGAPKMFDIMVADARAAGKPIPRGNPAKIGQKMKDRFFNAIPALAKLQEAVRVAVKKKSMKGLDGRPLHIRSEHSALNLLLQSAGALLCKQWIVLTDQKLVQRGYRHAVGGDFRLAAWVHDEQQQIVRDGLEHEVGQVMVDACHETGVLFNFRCPLGGEYKVGQRWSETH